MEFARHVPNLRHLRMLQAIGEENGVSGAARVLAASQPAVTQAVLNFETELGAAIFERRSTGTYPTASGRRFLWRVARFLDILDQAVAEVRTAGPQPVDRIMTGTQMRALMVMSEPGQLADHAARLGVSVASVNRAARALERVLGCPLFNRTAQGPRANATGMALARDFRRATRELDLGRGELRQAQGQGGLSVIVGCLPMAGSEALSTASLRFLKAHPGVKVTLVSGEYHALLDDLINSRIDLIFGVLRKPDWAEMLAEDEMFEDSYCLVARPGHPLMRLDQVTQQDAARHDWAVPARGTLRRARIDRIFADAGIEPSFNLETFSLGMCRALLANSDTLTLLTRSEACGDIRSGALVTLPCGFLTDRLPKGITRRRDWVPTAAHESFLTHLRAATDPGGSGIANALADIEMTALPLPDMAQPPLRSPD